MTYTPVTPFRRTVDAALLARQRSCETLPDATAEAVDKWAILRDLTAARARLGLNDRQLAVLQALLSFHPERELGGHGPAPVVYPSNAALCARLNGMPCSTMRRHLAALVKAGLVIRRDSPNGKRYARACGAAKLAFGFDLTPLPRRHEEIRQMAEAARAEERHHRQLRQSASLMRRDLAALVAYGLQTVPLPLWDRLGDLAALTARALRRRLSLAELSTLSDDLRTALAEAHDALDDGLSTQETSANDAQIEHHHQKSDKESSDSEKAENMCEVPGVRQIDPSLNARRNEPHQVIPLHMVREACPEIQVFAPNGLRHWADLIRAADIAAPMMDISPSAWVEARETLGPEQASVVVAAILERFDAIRSPGGYLRSLARKARGGGFSCLPMVTSLVHRQAA